MNYLSIPRAETYSWLKTTIKSCVTLVCYHISAEQEGVSKVGVGQQVGVCEIAQPQAPASFRPRRKPSRSEHKQRQYLFPLFSILCK